MSRDADRILWQVHAAGGAVEPAGDRGDRLRLIAPEPLPDDLVAAVRAHKREILATLRRPPGFAVAELDPGERGHTRACPDADGDPADASLIDRVRSRAVVYVRSRVLEEVVAWATEDSHETPGPTVYRETEPWELVGRTLEELRAVHGVKDDEILP